MVRLFKRYVSHSVLLLGPSDLFRSGLSLVFLLLPSLIFWRATLLYALALTVALPVIAATAAAINLESAGPAFHPRRRVGLSGQTFDIVKLRWMRHDAESGGRAVRAARDDPRMTRVGRYAENHSPFLDLLIPTRTRRVVLWPEGAR